MERESSSNSSVLMQFMDEANEFCTAMQRVLPWLNHNTAKAVILKANLVVRTLVSSMGKILET